MINRLEKEEEEFIISHSKQSRLSIKSLERDQKSRRSTTSMDDRRASQKSSNKKSHSRSIDPRNPNIKEPSISSSSGDEHDANQGVTPDLDDFRDDTGRMKLGTQK